MNQSYIDYAQYNKWANARLIADLQRQPDHILTEPLMSSFPTIRATILHIWFAEVGWLSRLNGSDWDTKAVDLFEGSNTELFAAWGATSQEYIHFCTTADLEKEIKFMHRLQSYSIPSREIIHTVMNHGSYHRGQVVTMMQHLGITNISQTDYIEWVRQQNQPLL